jgi:N-dimethylarginine dimethylaminohydrolase
VEDFDMTSREATARRYLMCRPTYFTVEYQINPWMHPTVPTDNPRAVAQWTNLRDAYRALGHTVEEIEPIPGLPDMVFAANGATVIDGIAYGAQFRYPQRAAEAPAYAARLAELGFETSAAKWINEGEGDFLLTDRYLLAGTGFRTEYAAHAEAQEVFGRPVVSLQLVDPRFYHLDTALAVLGDTIAFLPEAFSPGSVRVLRRLFPDAIEADLADAEWLGLNAVCDGKHVVLPVQATGLAEQVRAHGFEPVPVDVSEFLKAGGGPKCCTLELRDAGRAS